MVEVVEKLILDQPTDSDSWFLRFEDDVGEDVAHVDAGRFVETTGQHLETVLSEPTIGLQSLQLLWISSNSSKDLPSNKRQQSVVVFFVPCLEFLFYLRVDLEEEGECLWRLKLEEENLHHHQVDIDTGRVPVVRGSEDDPNGANIIVGWGTRPGESEGLKEEKLACGEGFLAQSYCTSVLALGKLRWLPTVTSKLISV